MIAGSVFAVISLTERQPAEEEGRYTELFARGNKSTTEVLNLVEGTYTTIRAYARSFDGFDQQGESFFWLGEGDQAVFTFGADERYTVHFVDRPEVLIAEGTFVAESVSVDDGTIEGDFLRALGTVSIEARRENIDLFCGLWNDACGKL